MVDKRIERILAHYFDSLNAWDENRHFECIDSRVQYFGSVSGLHGIGVGTVRGVFRGVRDAYDLRRLAPRKVFGAWPEVAVVVDIYAGDPPVERRTEGIWHFVFNEEDQITRLSILWDPSPLLKRRS